MFVLTDYTLVFNRSALVWEPGEPSLRALLHQRFRMGIGWNLMRMKYPALYKANKQPFNPQQMWWKVRGSAIKAIHLIKLNLGLPFGRNREATIDANIRQLMSWAQWLGGHYGRWWLDSRGIHPEPVELEKLRQLLSKKDPLHGRVGLVEMPALKRS
jgi:hypothetical protein